ncbi:MAG: glycosyltransferase family 4 protein [Bernardetiaceae bacterium]|nr:glycosyltransferase family 4 protein [Bernardetiaceae bacterium]
MNHITGDIHFVASFLAKRRTILTILDIGFMGHPSALARAILQFFWLTVPVKRARLVTTISQATKNEVLKHVRCDPNKIKVIHVPISDNFRPQPKPFCKEKPIILQLGCAPNKNLERLAEALRGLSCHLEVVGKLPEAVEAKLKAYQISYHVSWNLSQAEVEQKYRDCDIVTLISTYEGFGMPIVEANAVGRVVITGNILSMPEVAADAAHLVDPYDVAQIRAGFEKIITDDGYRAQLIANGFVNRQRFTPHLITEQHAELYREITQR